MRCQCLLRSGPQKGQQCPHPAKYPPQFPRFCGMHRECIEILPNKKTYEEKPFRFKSQKTPTIPHAPRQTTTLSDKDYFKTDSDLREDEKKWCRCTLHVASKQTDPCLENPVANAFKVFNGQQCYNPYSVCASTIGITSRRCGDQYDFTQIPDPELRAYAVMKHLVIPQPFNREELIKTITKWKEQFI